MSDPDRSHPDTAVPSGAGSRQRVERMPGARRAKLTPAPGTTAEPDADALLASDEAASARPTASGTGPNDERLRRDVPPHY